ncbi:MAG: HEAT repeat domain-containing protein [Chloroflexi bacterium]|nr:HEAT repeat domain-containing protein [Chloroflexota bacterium]
MKVETGRPVATASHLVDRLYDDDGMVRAKARETIIKLGKPLTPRLIALLSEPGDQVRWEAAKALAEIADPAAAPALVGALVDRSFGVRWLAATGLIVLGRDGLIPLLRALMADSSSVILRHSAHRVIFDLVGREQLVPILAPVLEALESAEPAVSVPLAAHTALEQLLALK